MNTTNNALENLSQKADLVIHKYALMAGVSGAIPVPGVDASGDTACQLVMIYEIQDIYHIKMSKTDLRVIIGILVDNLIPQKLISKVASLLKAMPGIGTVVGSATKYIVDFMTTLCIGKVCQQIFEYMYVHNLQPNKDMINEFVKTAIKSSLSYVKSNWKTILSAEKHLIPKYEVDLKRELTTFETNLGKNPKMYEAFLRLCYETNQVFIDLGFDTDHGFGELEKLCEKLAIPSLDLVIAELKLKRLKGFPLSLDELALIDLDENKDVVLYDIQQLISNEGKND